MNVIPPFDMTRWEYLAFLDTLRKVRDDEYARELDVQADDYDQAIRRDDAGELGRWSVAT